MPSKIPRPLRRQFGPEYERAVREHGDPRKAEAVLNERARRVEKFHVVSLSPIESARFTGDWKSTQALFVDNPKGAVRDADRLVVEVMKARGYPIGDFEQRAADVSVDHPRVVDNYRKARAIAVKNDTEGATTEELRAAMVHFRSLFGDLLEAPAAEHVEVRR